MATARVNILFGPPGTGKTTRLLGHVATLLAAHDPTDIAFVSFTRAAVTEARTRAAAQLNLSPDSLRHFRTLHATAYHQLGLTKGDVMRPSAYREVAESMGLVLRGSYDEHTAFVLPGGDVGDAALRLYALQRATGRPLAELWARSPERDLPWSVVQEFVQRLRVYKQERHVLDFADMLEACQTPLDVHAFVLDEAQDLSPAQWALAKRLAATAKVVWVAGDDDQAIYSFAGADARRLIHLPGARTVLPQSHRLPRRVKHLADRVSARLVERVPKVFLPQDRPGAVTWLSHPEALPLAEAPGTWLLLARHRHLLAHWVHVARQHGMVYRHEGVWSNQLPEVTAALVYERLRHGKGATAREVRALLPYAAPRHPVPPGLATYYWDDCGLPLGRPPWFLGLPRLAPEAREYIRAFLHRQEPVQGPGRVEIDTIHGVKGREADHVALLTDVTSAVLQQLQSPHTDAEQRVWYVGLTRPRHRLFLVEPMGPRFWLAPA